MKSRYPLLTILFTGIISIMVFDAAFNEANSHTSGAPAVRTGSPGDGGATCKNCHAGPNPTTQAGLITSNIPVAGYTGGQTYTITATITRSGHTKFGFEISPQNISGTQLGTLIVTNTTEMQLVGSGKYITHKSAGVTGTNARTWTFNWTAPVAGTGNVTFYGAFNITNAMNNSSGDTTVLSTLTVSECAVPAQPGAISGNAVLCPNAAGTQTYSVTPVTGATGYNWTFPNGWTVLSAPSNSMDVQPSSSSGTITVSASNTCGTSATRTLNVTIDQLAVGAVSTNINCNGANNGTASANASSGSLPYAYAWSPGGGTTAVITNLGVGSYTVVVTDAAGCTSTANTVITQPSAISLNATSSSAHCGLSNGSAAVTASGGTGSYLYAWSTIPVQTTATATNLSAGTYTVIVTDANGCTATTSTTVTNVAGPAAGILSSVNVNCNGAATGSAIATQTGGTPPFTYLWSPSGGAAANATNLAAGNYSVMVTDANGCTSSAFVTISQPAAISLNTSVTNAHCGNANGSATVFASGGVAGYTYSWNTVPVQTTVTASNLLAGNYSVIVTDANSCTATANVAITTVAGPSASAVAHFNVSCHSGSDGEAGVNVTGGTAPLSYNWIPSGGTDSVANNLHAGTYTAIVTDANGCTGSSAVTITEPAAISLNTFSTDAACAQSNGNAFVVAGGGAGGYTYLWNSSPVQITDSAFNLAAGSYVVTVTDSNGCSASATVGVNNISGPSLTAGTSTDVTCFNGNDGALSVIVSGGTGPYAFVWSPSGGTDTLAGNLHAGAYSVTVTDSLGCISVLTAVVNEPPALVADAGSNVTLCAGESAILGNSPVASGGTSGYSYQWSPAGDLSSSTDSMPLSTPAGTTGYALVVTDAHGCMDTANVTVTVNPLPQTPVISMTTDTLFSTPAFSYQWYLNGTLLNGFTFQSCIPFQNGNYSVVITDASGCSAASADFLYSSTFVVHQGGFMPVVIYPNPATIQLKIDCGLIKNANISFYNLTGERMPVLPARITDTGLQIIDVTPLPAGIYLLEIISGENKSWSKFAKE